MAGIPQTVQDDIIRAGRRMDHRGWVPATAGNISMRFHEGETAPTGRIAITRSGGHKGFLDATSIIEVNHDGRSLTPDARPSAETLLHCQIYRVFPQANAVLHGHSVAGTVLSMLAPAGTIDFAGYEIFKAFGGQPTHDAALSLPVFPNDQDIARLATLIEPHLAACKLGYIISGHGAYVWAPGMDVALVHLEALEFLLDCELARCRIAQPAPETVP